MSKREMTCSKRNRLTAGIALLATLLLASCTEEETPGSGVPPGNSLYVASAIIAPAPRTEVDTRVAGDDVPVAVTSGSLGIFRSKGTGYAGTLDNKQYTYDATQGWQPATAADTLFLNGDDAEVCAYYPYNGDAFFGSPDQIMLISGKYAGFTYLNDNYEGVDICYATNRTVNAARRATTFEMKHALSMLEFRISKEATYTGECRITSISVMNPEMILGSSIDITTGTYSTNISKGTITYNPGTDANGILIEKDTVPTSALLVPFTPTDEGLTIAFIVNGTPVETVISATDIPELKAGRRYSVKVTMKANSMQVTGVDMIPWDEVGVGGDDYTWYPVEEEKVIDIGLDFLIAPGNVRATSDGKGGYTYKFAEEQGYYSGVEYATYNPAGGDYFCWNTLDPSLIDVTQPSWDDTRDVCRKIGDGQWSTPTRVQIKKFFELNAAGKAVWGTYTLQDGTTKNGMYFGTATVPDQDNQDKYAFLPAAGSRYNTLWSSSVGGDGYYWSSTPNSSSTYGLDFDKGSCNISSYSARDTGFSVRCVKNKPIDIGLDFLIAPGNVIATSDGAGGYTYKFAEEQGYYAGNVDDYLNPAPAGTERDYFNWNTLKPEYYDDGYSAWDDKRDPCRQIGDGKWYTPTIDQLALLKDNKGGSVWGTYTKSDNTTVNGRYFGTTSSPSQADQNKYVFLPAAGDQQHGGMTTKGYYWSATIAIKPTSTDPDQWGYKLSFEESQVTGDRTASAVIQGYPFNLRCVRNK